MVTQLEMGTMIEPSKPIRLIGKKQNDLLHTPAEMLDDITDEVRALASKMLATVRVQNGIAIAAVQVGVPINLVVLRDGSAFVNMEIEPTSDELDEDLEGCLSLPGKVFKVLRHKEVQVSGITIYGQYCEAVETGFAARMWQHENDHLMGRLLTDKRKK